MADKRVKTRYLLAFIESALSQWKLIAVAAVLAAAVTYGTVWLLPRYTSITLLSMDETNARIAESIMRSTAVTESVLTKFPEAGESQEQRKRYLEKNLRLMPAVSGRGPTLFEMRVTNRDPAAAKRMASDLIDRWLELTKPGPFRKSQLEDDLARYESLAEELSSLLKRLGSESTALVYPNSFQGELATPIHALTEKQDQVQKAIADTKAKLAGTPRDVILVPPNLPTEPNTAGLGWAVLAACLVLLLMLGLVAFRSIMLPMWRDSLTALRAARSTSQLPEGIVVSQRRQQVNN